MIALWLKAKSLDENSQTRISLALSLPVQKSFVKEDTLTEGGSQSLDEVTKSNDNPYNFMNKTNMNKS
jgi:hypothetical protein